MPKDETRRTVLAHLRQRCDVPELLKHTKIARATLYRYLDQLKTEGLAAAEGDTYFVTAAGLKLLDDGPNDAIQRPLECKWPWLKVMPTQLHRALFVLALFAFAARKSTLCEDCHPALILLGPTQRMKSWLCKTLCYFVGSEPERCRVSMQQVRQRGLLVRLDSKGEVSYVLEQLKEAFLWLEEFSLAEPGVVRDVTALMQGGKQIRIENKILEVAAVPLIEMNPVKDAGSLVERIGLRPERLRRALIADFAAVEVSRALRSDASARLERLKSIAPLILPAPSMQSLSAKTLELLHEAVEQVVRPEVTDLVDPSRLITLILGASAILEERDAAVEVLWSWGELAASTQFLLPDWRARLAALLVGTPVQSQSQSQSQHQSNVDPLPADDESKECHMNRYKFEDVLIEHKRILDKSGLRLPEDTALIQGFLETIAEFKKNKVPTEKFFNHSKAWADLALINSKLEQFEKEGYDLSRIVSLINEMDRVGMTVLQLGGFLGIQDQMDNLQINGIEAFGLTRIILKEIEESPDKFSTLYVLLDAALNAQTLSNRVAELHEREKELKQRIEILNRQATRDLEKDVARQKSQSMDL